MAVTAKTLKALIDSELAQVSDARVVRYVRAMLVEPHVAFRTWDYSDPLQQYPCWFVLRDPNSSIEMAYCEYGFGPRYPWGIGLVSADEKDNSMGEDTAWYPTFLDAFFESLASVELPIWKVFRIEADGTRTALTEEGAWDATWHEVYELRANNPSGRYDCEHDVQFRKQK